MIGQIIKVISGFYDVKSEGHIYRVRGSGNLRNEGTSPLVGDLVEFTQGGFLSKILPRKNCLVRPKVANVDQVVVVTSMANPKYSSLLLNKFLAIIEHSGITPIIALTKTDLVDITPKNEYISQGYQVYEISNVNHTGYEEIRNIFKGKLTVFTGQTGAGKSSLINSLTGSKQETQEISKALGRGKHTTRVVEIIDWQEGQLIDSPGFSSLQIDLTPLDLSKAWHDFEYYSQFCQFPKNCLHLHEKECGVKKAVQEGKISENRYNDYLKILKEITK